VRCGVGDLQPADLRTKRGLADDEEESVGLLNRFVDFGQPAS
jgi:hypothetical protein